MNWPIALSFTERDVGFVAEVANEIRQCGLGAYFYLDHCAAEAGLFLMTHHSEIYLNCLTVGMFLRPDFLLRPYPALEHSLAKSRNDFPDCVSFFLMDNECQVLIPTKANFVYETFDCSGHMAITPKQCSRLLVANAKRAPRLMLEF